MYKKDAQIPATKYIRGSGSPMLQEDTRTASFHLEKKKGETRLAGVRAGFYEHVKHCERETRKRTIQAKEPEGKDR